MKNLSLTLLILSATMAHAWETATAPTTAPTSDIAIGSSKTPTATTSSSPLSTITSLLNPIKGLLGGGGGGGKSGPSLDLNFDFTSYEQKVNQTCNGTVTNSITNLEATTQIMYGTCTGGSGQQMGSMGKVGDVTLIPVERLAKAKDFGIVIGTKNAEIALPRESTSGFDNAVYFTFKPANPQVSSQWVSQGLSNAALKGREEQVVIRTVPLTRELATKEGHLEAFSSGGNQILVELWTRTLPSVTGSPEFKQIQNLVLPATEVGKNILFSVNEYGDAGLGFTFKDRVTKDALIFASGFSVTKETP